MTYQVDITKDPETNAAKIRNIFGDTEYSFPDVVLECTGVESSIMTSVYATRRGGSVMVIGVGRPFINNVPFMHMSLSEVSSVDTYACRGQMLT